MKILIDELPPQNYWAKPVHGTSLTDYPIARHSISQSNPDIDRSHWTPQPAFHKYSDLKCEGHPKTLTKKERERLGTDMDSASSDSSSSPKETRPSRIRVKMKKLFSHGRGGGGKVVDQENEPMISTGPTETMSLGRRVRENLRHKLAGRRPLGNEVREDIPTEQSTKTKGKGRESEPESGPSSGAVE